MRTTRQEWLLREVQKAHEALGTLRDATGEVELERRKWISQALSAGVKQADIARITGLSRERVRQLR